MRSFSYSHQLRIFQCVRILSRDEELCTQVLVKQEQAIEVLIVKLIELAQKCINGQNHSFNAGVTGNFSSPGGIGPGGSGPIQNDEEIICDILTELISTLFPFR